MTAAATTAASDFLLLQSLAIVSTNNSSAISTLMPKIPVRVTGASLAVFWTDVANLFIAENISVSTSTSILLSFLKENGCKD